MNYPNFRQLLGSKSEHGDGVVIDRAADGSVRSRSTWNRRRRSFAFRHVMTQVEYDQLLAFYDARRGVDAEFDFVWRPDGQTYRCIFNAPPKEDSIEKTANGIRYFVTCNIVEV